MTACGGLVGELSGGGTLKHAGVLFHFQCLEGALGWYVACGGACRVLTSTAGVQVVHFHVGGSTESLGAVGEASERSS